jgi:hypothetical protein
MREIELKTDVPFERIIGEMRTGFAELRGEMSRMETRLVVWMIGTILVGLGVLFGLLKALPG